MQQEVLSKLGDYLLARRDEIIGEWVRTVERNPDISSSGHLDYKELVDHLPELCRELAELLKLPQGEQSRSEISTTARVHGGYRWSQGYRLEEVIREASIVRRILFHDWVDAFARETPEFDGETRRVAERIIHQAVDDVVTVSAEQFVQEQQKSISQLNAELADALAELRKEKAASEAANAAKDKFLAMLSHELRTPLNPILLWTGATLEEEELDPMLRKDVEMVRHNVELEASLIDDLLDVARITGGKLQLHLQLSDAASLFRDALEMVKAETVRKQLEVRVEFSATNHVVSVDPARLQQVFWNVVKNAQKFSPEGGTICIRSYNPREDRVLFEITDSGKGIEPDLLPRIFGAFEQGAGPTEGLGLGLAISKGIIEAHGGSIHASSAGTGTGATFTIELKTYVQDGDEPSEPRIGG
ncbi:MAG: sensor histidine kinase [Chthoniobacterales bacterium]|nr:sensor histidine kinase [Chthoniobacterales bacterium]